MIEQELLVMNCVFNGILYLTIVGKQLLAKYKYAVYCEILKNILKRHNIHNSSFFLYKWHIHVKQVV